MQRRLEKFSPANVFVNGVFIDLYVDVGDAGEGPGPKNNSYQCRDQRSNRQLPCRNFHARHIAQSLLISSEVAAPPMNVDTNFGVWLGRKWNPEPRIETSAQAIFLHALPAHTPSAPMADIPVCGNLARQQPRVGCWRAWRP